MLFLILENITLPIKLSKFTNHFFQTNSKSSPLWSPFRKLYISRCYHIAFNQTTAYIGFPTPLTHFCAVRHFPSGGASVQNPCKTTPANATSLSYYCCNWTDQGWKIHCWKCKMCFSSYKFCFYVNKSILWDGNSYKQLSFSYYFFNLKKTGTKYDEVIFQATFSNLINL